MGYAWLGGAVALLTAIFTGGRGAMTSHSYGTARAIFLGAGVAVGGLLYFLLNPTDITTLAGPVGASWQGFRIHVAMWGGAFTIVAAWTVVGRVQRKWEFNQTWVAQRSVQCDSRRRASA